MGIEVKWYNEDRDLLIVTFQGRWTWDEAFEGDAQMKRFMDSVSHKVDSIVDLRRSPWIPPDYAENMDELKGIAHPNTGLLVVVGSSIVWEVFQLYTQMYGDFPYATAYSKTLREAHRLIRERRASDRLPRA